MDFLCYNFCQINDNVVAVEMIFLVIQLSVICNFFNFFSGFERGYNSPEPLEEESINPSDQLVNINSSEKSNFYNMSNEVPPRDSNDANKNKEHKISALYHSN